MGHTHTHTHIYIYIYIIVKSQILYNNLSVNISNVNTLRDFSGIFM